MADIFERTGNTLGGTFAADAATIVFATGGVGGNAAGGSGGVGLLTQNVQVGYQQQVTRLYEVGSNYTFLVAGRTMGTLSLGRVLGPRPVQTQFYQNYGNVCNAANNIINLAMTEACTAGSTSGSGTGSLAFKLNNVVLTSISISIAAQDMLVNEQVQAMFVSLDLG